MYIINRIKKFSKETPLVSAYISEDGTISYEDLWKYIQNVANYISKINISKTPVVVYGHKESLTIISFFALAMVGCAYIPVDVDTPKQRINDIISQSGARHLFNICDNDIQLQGVDIISKNELQRVCYSDLDEYVCDNQITYNTVLYIMFTSGTNGKPKGTPISHGNISSFLKFLDKFDLLNSDEHSVVLNQARYSFDLSVADIYYAIYNGKTLFALEQYVQKDFSKLFSSLDKSRTTIAIMTPSFANYCMLDKSFNNELMQDLKVIFFCGEQLYPETVKKLWTRFPDLKVINAYGPTECTVAVSGVEITPHMCNDDMLPMEKYSDKSNIYIDADSGSKGNIIIYGDSVSSGYLSSNAGGFFNKDGVRHYDTGDIGIEKNGYVYCLGREDRQIKLGGYRIELDDIERVCKSNIDRVTGCAVSMDQKSKRIIMWVSTKDIGNQRESIAYIKMELKNHLPSYACPHKIIVTDTIPMTSNGKCDYKKLLKEYV